MEVNTSPAAAADGALRNDAAPSGSIGYAGDSGYAAVLSSGGSNGRLRRQRSERRRAKRVGRRRHLW